MPNNATYKQETRKQPDVYEIRKNNYSPQFEVSARTTDHFMGVGEDGDAKSLVETLKTFQQGVGNYTTLQELQKKDNALKAKSDFVATGGDEYFKDKPASILNLGVGYDEAWDTLAGQKHAAETLQPQVNQFYQDNGHLPPSEFQAKLRNEVLAPNAAQIKSGHQAAGFLPEAQSIMDGAIKANQARWNKSTQIERDALVSSGIRTDVERSLQLGLGVNSLEQLFDPQYYKEYLKSSTTLEGVSKMEGLSNALYSMYRQGMANAKAVGKTTAEYSAEFLGTVSGVATKYGMPELLQYAFKSYQPTPEELAQGKKPDNITVSDAFREKVEADIREATTVKYKMEAAIKAQEKEAHEKAQRKLTRDTNDKLFDLLNSDDPMRIQKTQQLQQQYRNEATALDMNPEENKFVNNLVKAVNDRGSFARASNDMVITKLYSKGATLTHEDVLVNRTKLEEKDFTKLMDRAWQYEKAKIDRADANSKYGEHLAINLMLQGIKNGYQKFNQVTGIIEPEAQYKLGQLDQMLGVFLRNNPNANAAQIQEHYQKSILPLLPLPQNIIKPEASKQGATPPKPEVAPAGTKAQLSNGKTVVSDGKGNWY